MNQQLKTIQDFIQQNSRLSQQDKEALLTSVKEADKELSITTVKLDDTETEKRTTAILLEKTIKELEQKRKTVETQNTELQIEASLERVRAISMTMRKPADLLNICEVLFAELQTLGFNELRNALIHTFVDEKNYFIDYDYSDSTGGRISQIPYSGHPVIEKFIKEIRKTNDAFVEIEITGQELQDWKEFRQANGEANDPRLDNMTSLYYYNYSIGAGGIGISTFSSISNDKLKVLKRFRNVFDLSYQRYTDITLAEAQAREAKIEAVLEKVRSRTMSMQKSEELKEVIQVVYEQFVQLKIFVEHAGFIMDYKTKDEMHIWLADKHAVPFQVTIPYFDCAHWKSFNEAKEKGMDFFANHLSFEEKNKFYQDLFKLIPGVPEETLEYYFSCPGLAISTVLLENVGLYIENFSGTLYTDEENNTLMRFGKVFQQTYTRFLDLQKAEAQARESQIQLALERVRARTMAMQKSDELAETASLLFKQINDLGIQTWTSGFNIWEQNDTSFIGYNPTPTGEIAAPYHIPSTENSFFKNIYEAKKRGEEFLVFESAGESLAETYNYMKTLPVVKQVLKGIEDSGFQLPTFQINHCAFFSQGFLLFITLEAYPDGHNIFKRFAKVFEQTYTRFLDLQKAEAQAREAKIEAALERIRSTAMAMHSSEGILEVTHVLREQIALLGEKEVESILVHIYHEDTDQFEAWYSYRHPEYSKGQIVNGKQTLNWSKTARARKDKEKYYEKETDYTIVADRKMLKEWYEYLFKLAPEVVELNDKGEILVPDVLYYNYSKISGGTLLLITNSEASDHSKYLLTRAATVFNLAYSRFLDLQKAEAQAREAKIEVALERVRSRAMAMQNSDELSELVAILFEELVKLDLILARCIIWIFDADTLAARVWMANSEDKKTAESYFIKRLHHPYYEAIIKGWKERNPKWVFDLGGPYKKSIDELLLSETELSRLSETVKMGIRSSTHTIISGSFNNFGFIEASGPAAHSEEQLEILNRFGKVFDLSYTRFNDLKQAEAQAREAKVEASLERVRGKAMAMHSSEDLAATIVAFYHELELFSITPRQCGVGLLNKESRIAELSTMNSTGGGSSIELIGKLEMTGHPVLEGVYDNWLVQKEYHPVLRGNEIKKYYQLIRPQIAFPDYPDDEVQYGYFFFFPEGGVYAWTEKLMGEEELKIYRRFTSVLNLTYKRYKDLQQAETNAREAVKQAALDRVRAEIASMRTTNDLEKITPLIWNELTIIGIPFIRCGVFIMDDSQKLIRTFLSTPKGKAIAAFHLPYGTPGNIAQVLAHWQNKKNYIDHWDEAAFTEFAATLVKQGALLSPEQYLEAIPRGGFYLHFLPFLQGMLYVGNTTRLVEQEIKLIQSVADAFSTAYARYEDFNKLEAAKQQVDETLADLKQAQTQLIQSEKMASLGELTAGIAHEIQNPLNFVNNFSEVNTELIDEMKSELAGGNGREAMNIADNIKENEQKINHHGKRADAIVKGMLQHSRASGGQKELTNINVLADEYLRLSYHGLRAKDKSFNADFKTDFDEMIGLINIVPQDIGRVLLNLYNNAFYAVAEKKKQQHNGYEPIISVGTKKLKDKIEITVKDNGNGMPQKVLDKIFQPFFTTKPTGQGTGLGLSLSYDVIKSHGGEIKAETKEGEGTEFVVVLPVDQR